MTLVLHSLGRLALCGLLLTAVVAPAPPRAFAQVTPPPQCEQGRIAFTRLEQGSGSEVFVMNADGSGQTALTNSPANDAAPAFSPDGARIAFQSDRDNPVNTRPDIYVMNANGGNVVRLTNAAAADDAPEWSPDGTKIAFTSARDDTSGLNHSELYVMNADGSGQTRLTFGMSVQPRPSWSPDGTRIVFSARGGLPPDPSANNLFAINPAGGTPTRLTSSPDGLTDVFPEWSPDGRHIAFIRSVNGRSDTSVVYTVKPDGSGLTKLIDPATHYSYLSYSTDGSALAFVRLVGTFPNVVTDVFQSYPDGSSPVNLTNHPAHDASPSWAPPQTTAPCLLTEPGTERAAALASVAHTRDPFPVTVPSTHNLSPTDRRTRVMLFFRNLRLAPIDQTTMTAQAEDSQGRLYNLVVEFIGKVPDHSWLSQVNVILPPELAGQGDVRVSIRVSGGQSNKAIINVAPAGT